MTTPYNLLEGLVFAIVLFVCYLIFRNYYANYDLKDDLRELNNRLYTIAVILAIFSIIFLLNIDNAPWFFSFFYGFDKGYTYRGIGIGLLVLSFAGLSVSAKFKMAPFFFPSIIPGIAASFISIVDIKKFNLYLNIFSIISFIIFSIVMVNIFINENEIRKNLKGNINN